MACSCTRPCDYCLDKDGTPLWWPPHQCQHPDYETKSDGTRVCRIPRLEEDDDRVSRH